MNSNAIDVRTRLFRERAGTGAAIGLGSYKGLPEQSKTGLMAHVAASVSERIAKGSRIADLASGTGALALRLEDSGYHVEAADYVAGNFRVPQIPFRAVDLNSDFSRLYPQTFDAVTATEIIEHLENPRHFLREISKMLRPGGELFLTTPNVDSPVSKAFLLAFGHYSWFEDEDYEGMGHITPVPVRTLKQAAAEGGYSIERLDSFGDPTEKIRRWPSMRWYARAVGLLDRSPHHLRGDILVAILKRGP